MVQRLTPQTELGSEYEFPDLSRTESHDEGIDLTAKAKQGPGILYIQSKLWIDRAEDLDSILSKFEAFQEKYHNNTGSDQWPRKFEEPLQDRTVRFLIITASKLEGVKKRYRERQYSSRRFYDTLISSDRLETVDGLEIFSLLNVQHASAECFVPVKLVESSNAWDVAKAANYQNAVNDIDLELARHLRPQIVKRAANIADARIEDGKESAFQIVDSLYDQRVAYQETRLLYIGLFSRQPNNLYSSNYTEINRDLVSRFYQEDQYGTNVFEMLFSLQGACGYALEDAKRAFRNSSYSSLFDRYYKEDSPTYRCFVGILAACGAVQINIADRKPEPSAEFERMRGFIVACTDLLANDPPRFKEFYILALKIWMTSMMDAGGDEGEIRKFMNLQSRRADFSNMFKKICMEADLSEALRKG